MAGAGVVFKIKTRTAVIFLSNKNSEPDEKKHVSHTKGSDWSAGESVRGEGSRCWHSDQLIRM